jgi:APA family basic amino acid/polyamine antiporter
MAIMASEVKEPRRTIPFAVIGGIAIAAVVFALVGAATLGVLGADGMKSSENGKDTPLIAAGIRTMGRWGMWIVLATAWLDTLTEAWGDLLVVTRVALATGKQRELPSWLGVVHQRFRSPHHAVIALGIICTVLAAFLDLRPVLAVANVFTLTWYTIVLSDALMLPKEKRLVWPVVSWFGVLGCLALFAALPWWALLTGGGVLVALVGIRWLARRKFAGR